MTKPNKQIKLLAHHDVFNELVNLYLNKNLPNKKKQIIKNIKIPLIGIHNIRNSVAAAAVALTVGITTNDIKNGLLRFNGVQRRFNKIFSFFLF